LQTDSIKMLALAISFDVTLVLLSIVAIDASRTMRDSAIDVS